MKFIFIGNLHFYLIEKEEGREEIEDERRRGGHDTYELYGGYVNMREATLAAPFVVSLLIRI